MNFYYKKKIEQTKVKTNKIHMAEAKLMESVQTPYPLIGYSCFNMNINLDFGLSF
jgi:hypothetical protein